MGKNHHGRRYPWDKWLAQDCITLTEGIDFNGTADNMSSYVRRVATSRGMRVKTRVYIGKGLGYTPRWQVEITVVSRPPVIVERRPVSDGN
jgi:hypothetical protein